MKPPRIETRKLADLKPWERNPRRISDRALGGLKASIGRFGLLDLPVVLPDGTIVGGHQRVRAMRAQGIDEAPCVVADLTPEDAKAANVALNSPSITGKFDEGLQAILDEVLAADERLYADLLLDDLAVAAPAAVDLDDEQPPGGSDAEIVQCPKCGLRFEP